MSDRHEKWQRVEAGHVIPAGQPYRIEPPASFETAIKEWPKGHDLEDYRVPDWTDCDYFVDSLWRPPLEALLFKGVWSAPIERERYEAYRGVIDAARSLVDSVEDTP